MYPRPTKIARHYTASIILLSSPFFCPAIESTVSVKKKKKKERPLQQEEIIKLLKSVGGRKGNSSRVHAPRSESASLPHNMHYNPAQFRKINTSHYRSVHEDVRRALREEGELVSSKAEKLVRSMREQEQYRRRCGSRVLCLDGGGIRGLLQMATLREIERQTGRRIVELFDWIVGTSTGGIIALSLTYGK
jgi:hypothetical protein